MKKLEISIADFLKENWLGNFEYYQDCDVWQATILDCNIQLLIEGKEVLGYVSDSEWYSPCNASLDFMSELSELFKENNIVCDNDFVDIDKAYTKIIETGQYNGQNFEVSNLNGIMCISTNWYSDSVITYGVEVAGHYIFTKDFDKAIKLSLQK